MKTRDFIWAAAALCMCACSSENEVSPSPIDEGEIQLEMVYPGATSTRATDTQFEKTDQIGVYVTATGEQLQIGGNEVNNELFTYNGTSWTSARKVYWNEGSHDVYAYYPYSQKVNDIADYSFEVQADQSTAEGYTKSDFLWAGRKGVTASASPVSMQFAHKLSSVVVKLVKGENYTGDIPATTEVYIHSTVTKAAIDLSTGDATKDDYAGTSSIRCRQRSATEYVAIVVPQNITTRRPLVEVIAGGVSYLMEGKLSMKQGMRHTITVTLDKNPDQTKIDIGGEIGNW